MPNDTATALVICPFFHRFVRSGREIICDGLSEGVESGTVFPSHSALELWTGNLCNTFQYDRCPVAKAVEKLN
jgi:hypothetical protein